MNQYVERMLELFGDEPENEQPVKIELPFSKLGLLDDAIIGIAEVGIESVFVYSQVKLMTLFGKYLGISEDAEDRTSQILEYMGHNEIGVYNGSVSSPAIIQDLYEEEDENTVELNFVVEIQEPEKSKREYIYCIFMKGKNMQCTRWSGKNKEDKYCLKHSEAGKRIEAEKVNKK